MSEKLTVIERNNLVELEETIQKHLSAFYEVGFALMQIRDNRLYRETYATFEEYCKEKWDISRPRAYQLIKAAEVHDNLSTTVDNLSTIVDIPQSESVLRPLSPLPPQEQREVYQEAVKTAPEGKVTAKHVENIVKKRRPILANYPPSKISARFNEAFNRLVEEIKRENLNGWKETGRAEARNMVENLLSMIGGPNV